MINVTRQLTPLLGGLLGLLAATGAAAEATLLDRIVVVVEDDVITQSEFDERLQITRQRLSSTPPVDVLRRQVLERLVMEKLQLQEAERFGMSVDDITLNDATRDIARRNNMNLEEFRRNLLAEGIDYIEFREQIRNELVIDRLRQRQLQGRVRVSDQEIDEFIASQSGALNSQAEYRLGHILIALPEAASPEQIQAARERAQAVRQKLLDGEDFTEVAVSSSNGQRALEGGDLGWRSAPQLPSIFARAVTGMKTGDTSDLIRSPSGFHIVRLLEQRGLQRTMIEQTRARHILITPNELLTMEQAREKLAALRDRIEGGDDFAELSKANSDDKGSAANGGDLGWISPGEMVPEFEDVMKTLSKDEMSEPFRSSFGWHIVQVLDRREHDSTEESQRVRARDFIRERKAEEELELWLRRLRDESYVEYRLSS
ncbi:MAG: peptidylprolyl isomerase [Gammaproteobacteria bacterium]